MRHKIITATLMFFLLPLSAWWASGQSFGPGSTTTIPYEGRLEIDGFAFNGAKDIIFRLYDDPTVGVQRWEETQSVTVSGGNFGALLGSVNSLDATLAMGIDLYVDLTICDAAPATNCVALQGRQLLASVPYARRGAPGKDFVVTTLIGDVVAVGAAAPDPNATLHVDGSALVGAAMPASIPLGVDNTLVPTPYSHTPGPGDIYADGNIIAQQMRAANIGGCYTNWGARGCTAGYAEVLSGSIGGVENYDPSSSGVPRANPVCIDKRAVVHETFTGYWNRLLRSNSEQASGDSMDVVHPHCSICCRGGAYTTYGTDTCAAGFVVAYVGEIGGIEQYRAYSTGGSTFCVNKQAAAIYGWGASTQHFLRLMRYRDQPQNAGSNGMDSVQKTCAVCVSKW